MPKKTQYATPLFTKTKDFTVLAYGKDLQQQLRDFEVYDPVMNMATYPYEKLRHSGITMQRALFRITMSHNGAGAFIYEQERDFCPDVEPDVDLAVFRLMENDRLAGYDCIEDAVNESVNEFDMNRELFAELQLTLKIEVMPRLPQ